MALLILLYVAMIVWFSYLNEEFKGTNWRYKIYNILVNLFVWPVSLFQLIVSRLFWKRIIAILSWLIFLLCFEGILGVSFYWLFILTVVWQILLWSLWWIFCHYNKNEDYFPIDGIE